MTRDYYKLEPDKMYRLGKHYTAGRAGQKIQFITRHHLMFIGEGEAVVDRIWNTRPASAHHVIGPTGRWVQTVYDRDTAWANASQWANRRTIAIEHSNNTGRAHGNDYHPDSWNISDATIISGARVAAAYCLHFKLGRPVYGKNIRDHFEFTSTGCPVHLSGPHAKSAFRGGGKYHQKWMREAQRFYDQLVKKAVHPDGSPKTSPKNGGKTMSLDNASRDKINRIHHELSHEFGSRYPGSQHQDTLAGYVLTLDRKMEDMHANMLPSIWKKLNEINAKLEGEK